MGCPPPPNQVGGALEIQNKTERLVLASTAAPRVWSAPRAQTYGKWELCPRPPSEPPTRLGLLAAQDSLGGICTRAVLQTQKGKQKQRRPPVRSNLPERQPPSDCGWATASGQAPTAVG